MPVARPSISWSTTTWPPGPRRPMRWARGRPGCRPTSCRRSGIVSWGARSRRATPGRPSSQPGSARAVVQSLSVRGKRRGTSLIEDGDRLVVRLRFSGGQVRDPRIEGFVDDIEQEGELTSDWPLGATGDDHVAELPAFPAGSLVRFRVVGDRGAGPEVIAPR